MLANTTWHYRTICGFSPNFGQSAQRQGLVEVNPEADGADSTSGDVASTTSEQLVSSSANTGNDPLFGDRACSDSVSANATTTPLTVDEPQLSREEIAQRVMGGFQGAVPKHKTHPKYALGLLLAMVQFPIDMTCATWIPMVLCVPLFILHRDEPGALVFGIPLAVLGLGLLSAFFGGMRAFSLLMQDSHRPDYQEPRACKVTPEEEPLLWEFVRRIADTLGVEHPSQIEVVCDANAAVGRIRNAKGAVTKQETLIIGLPITVGMTVQQLAGVIAHELGHVAQKNGTRLTALLLILIRNTWGYFGTRDGMDDWVLQTISADERRITPEQRRSAWPRKLFLARVLNTWTRLPNLIYGYLKRQIEYDADQYHARFAGSGDFEQTTKCLAMHVLAFVSACDDVTRYRREKRLPDNLLPLVDWSLRSCSPETRSEFEKLLSEEETQLNDAYPSQRDRIAAAKQFDTPGVYRCKLPASVLFRNFEKLARHVTHDLYLKRFDDSVSVADFVPSDVLVSEMKIEKGRHDQTKAFCFGATLYSRSVPLPDSVDAPWYTPSTRPISELVKKLETVRGAMCANADSYRADVRKWYDAAHDVWKGNAARWMLTEGIKHLPKELAECDGKCDLPLQRRDPGHAEVSELNPKLCAFETMAGQRWRIATEILVHPDFPNQTPDALESVARTRAIMQLLAALDRTFNERRDLHYHIRTTQLLLDAKQDTYSKWLTICERIEDTKSRLESILRQFEGCEYPFPHNRPSLTVVEYLTPFEDMATISKKWLDGAKETIRTSWDLTNRATDYMCELTLEVEAALGLPPLPLVATEKEKGDDNSEAASQAA